MPGKFARIMEARIKAHILLANLGEKYIAGSCSSLYICMLLCGLQRDYFAN